MFSNGVQFSWVIRDEGRLSLCCRLPLAPSIRLLWAVRPISRSRWNGRFGAESGPSRGDPCRRASRPTTTFTATNVMSGLRRFETVAQTSQMRKYRSLPEGAPNGSSRPFAVHKIGHTNGRKAPQSGLRGEAYVALRRSYFKICRNESRKSNAPRTPSRCARELVRPAGNRRPPRRRPKSCECR